MSRNVIGGGDAQNDGGGAGIADGTVRLPSRGDLGPGLLTEYLTDDWGFFVRSARELERFRSPWQAIEVHDSVAFGRLFRLDGMMMTSERDEFFYHENLVHMAGLTHPSPACALIVGGGDGGHSLSDDHDRGIAGLLLGHLVQIARERGILKLEADVLAENRAMLTGGRSSCPPPAPC